MLVLVDLHIVLETKGQLAQPQRRIWAAMHQGLRQERQARQSLWEAVDTLGYFDYLQEAIGYGWGEM